MKQTMTRVAIGVGLVAGSWGVGIAGAQEEPKQPILLPQPTTTLVAAPRVTLPEQSAVLRNPPVESTTPPTTVAPVTSTVPATTVAVTSTVPAPTTIVATTIATTVPSSVAPPSTVAAVVAGVSVSRPLAFTGPGNASTLAESAVPLSILGALMVVVSQLRRRARRA